VEKSPIEVFGQWAEQGKDKGMEDNHRAAVAAMIAFSTTQRTLFSCIDAGCGNGWVVRLLAQQQQCQKAIGVDGAAAMIEKAKAIDPINDYYCEDLLKWKPAEKVDLVHSMEVFYYFENPDQLIAHIFKHWLKPRGRLIMGIDHYSENTASHSWKKDCGVSIMKLFPEKTWFHFFEDAGFKETQSWRVDEKENWAGTLVVTGIK